MIKQNVNNIKLGIFVLAGLVFLILLLYMIGRNRNLFGSNFILKAEFENVQGLKAGGNVRYAGIDVGTVKKINLINDTVTEVVMIIDDKAKTIIRKNAVASIATDGLVGNKVVNITSAKQASVYAGDGDVLRSKKPLDTDDMLRTLYKTNNDVAIIAKNLKTTVSRLNNSTALWSVLNDKGLPHNLQLSAYHIRLATAKANNIADDLYAVVRDVKNGGGSLGAILTDTIFAYKLNMAVAKIEAVGDHADTLSQQLSQIVTGIRSDVDQGKGIVGALLNDSAMVIKLNESLDNVRKGTDGFNQNMEALKHNFLFRGYFRKLENQKKHKGKQIETAR